jgi:DNA-binding XRE family transcriptional regulator
VGIAVPGLFQLIVRDGSTTAAAAIEVLRRDLGEGLPAASSAENIGRGRLHFLPNLAACRVATGLSIEDLAARAELARETIVHLENADRRAHLGTARVLAFVLGVPVEHLVDARQPERPTGITRRGAPPEVDPPPAASNDSLRGRLHYLPNLAAWRAAAELTITDLATNAELPRETVVRLESLKRRARLSTARSLALVLGVPVERLIGTELRMDHSGRPLGPIAMRRDLRATTGGQICRDCRRLKPLDAFTRIRACRDGFHGRCKTCRAARARKRYHSNSRSKLSS